MGKTWNMVRAALTKLGLTLRWNYGSIIQFNLLLPDLITMEHFKSILAALCHLLKQIHVTILIFWSVDKKRVLKMLSPIHQFRKKKEDISKLGWGIKYRIVSVTFWCQALPHVDSQSGLSCKTSHVSSLHSNHVICFSHRVCFTSQNRSGTVSPPGFHRRPFCHSSSTAAARRLIILTPESRIAALGPRCLACRPARGFRREGFGVLAFPWPRRAAPTGMVPHA